MLEGPEKDFLFRNLHIKENRTFLRQKKKTLTQQKYCFSNIKQK